MANLVKKSKENVIQQIQDYVFPFTDTFSFFEALDDALFHYSQVPSEATRHGDDWHKRNTYLIKLVRDSFFPPNFEAMELKKIQKKLKA